MKIKNPLLKAGLLLAGATQLIAQPNGPNYAWVRHLPDTDGAKAAAMDGLGHVYVLGTFSKTNTIGTNILIPASTSTESLFLAKYDSAGNVLWARHAGDTGASVPQAALTADSAGNAYVTSEFTRSNIVIGSITLTNSTTGGGASDMYVAKFNAAGVVQWARKSQGTGSEYGSAAGVDGQGNCYIGGHYTTAPDLTFDGVPLFVTTPNSGAFLVKYDSNGQVQWVRNGVNGSYLYCYGMAVDGTGNCFITGQAGSQSDFGYTYTNLFSGVRFFLMKYGPAGVIEWVKTNTVGTAEGCGVALGPDGSVHVTGDYLNSVAFTGAVAQLADSFHSMFVAKWDASGAFQWVQGPAGTTRSEANAIAVDHQTNCYAVGTFNGPLQFGSATVNDAANADFYVTKLNSAGQFQWVQIGGGNGPDEGWGVVVDPFGYVYADLSLNYSGWFGSFNPTGPSVNGQDFLLVKLDSGQTPTPLTLSIAMYAGVKIQGQPGGQVQVQYVNALGNTNDWQPLATFPFTNSPYIFIDYDSPTQPKRFYRALQSP